MDPDFADFLLDESHLDFKQKKVDDAAFLEALKITDNEEEEFLLKVDFEPEIRKKMDEDFEADFDIPFEITDEDLNLLEAQEKELLKNNEPKGLNTPKRQTGRRISSTTGNKENNSPSLHAKGNLQEINKLKADLELYRDRAETLNNELDIQKRQILTKEGEITILRQRLVQLDNEKIIIAQKYAELSATSRKNADKKSEDLKKEVENLKTELEFKTQELKSLSSSLKRKIPKQNAPLFESDLERLGTINVEPVIPKVTSKPTQIIENERKDAYESMSDLELFASFIQKIDLTWKFSDLKEFDTLDIVKAREFACDEIRRISAQSGDFKSGKALGHGIVKLFERGLYFRQPVLLTYISQIIAQIFDNCGDRVKDEILEIRDPSHSVIFFQQICTLLTGRIIVDGIPKEIIINQCLIINIILYQLESKIPEEFKMIIYSGFLQWILRWDKFNGRESEIIGMTLYSLSCDLNMLSAVFLSSAPDKIECMTVLDLLLSSSEQLIDSLFPRGKVYRSRFGSQLPILEDEIERLHKANVYLSLLFSFVHRSLGPIRLWIPEKMILSLVIWAIDVFNHDWRSIGTSEFLRPKVLIAQEKLLDTIFLGLAAIWRSKELSMPEILIQTRIPLLFVTQQIASHQSSFAGAVKSASTLSKIIDREVSDDIKNVYETGLLPRAAKQAQNT